MSRTSSTQPDPQPDDEHAEHHLLTDHRWALGASIGLYALAAVVFLAVAFEQSRTVVQAADDRWLGWMAAVEWGPLVGVTKALDLIGGAYVTVPIRVGVAGWLAYRRRWAAFATWLAATALSEVAVAVAKAGYGRPRPTASLVATTGFSFPSGHATAGAVTAIALVLVLMKPGWRRRLWEVLAGFFALAMAQSRTYLRAHWLSDAVAGVLLGAAVALGTAALVQNIRVRLRARAVYGPRHRPEDEEARAARPR